MRKLTHDEQVAAIAKINPNIEILGEITGSDVKVLCRCKICGYKWETKPYCIKNGHGCPECGKIKNADKLRFTHAEQVAAIAKVNPNVEVLGQIINNGTRVLCLCKICSHKWEATPSNLKAGHGCPECKKVKASNRMRMPHIKHVAAIAKINPDVEVLGEIINVDTKVLCRCKVCRHEWNARPNDLKHGCGCPECGKIKKANAKRLSHTEQVEAINKVNPNVEVLEEIKGNAVKVLCRCKACSYKWEARPSDLKNGHGCPKCTGKRKLSHKEQVAAINKVHPYIEVLGEITNGKVKVLCLCKTCGHKWQVSPYSLKAGKGCPRCAKHGFHSHETGKLYIMVDDLNIPTMLKIGVSINEDRRSKEVLKSARKVEVSIPALYVAKTWEGPTDLMQRIESMMHENYAEWNIKFPTKFDGFTEFFYYTPETAGVFDAIDETYYTVVNQF